MARFNSPSVGTKTTNLAGGVAFKQNPKLELASILLTSFAKDQFYRSGDDTFQKLKQLLGDPGLHKFAAKAAVYARTKFGMRSITHVLAAELAKVCKGQTWTKNFYESVVFRPDDATEILAYYKANCGKAIPNSLKKGLARALRKFSSYQLSKYKGAAKAFKLVDIVNLTHPKPTDQISRLVKGELLPAETWETKLTQAGQQAEDDEEKAELKGKAWGDLLRENSLGYFALLRNLWNISQQAPDVLDLALTQLVDEKKIRNSLVLPFRFQTAIRELSARSVDRKIIQALSKALDISVSNVPNLEGKTLAVLDVSGSMQGKPAEIGSLFAAILYKSNDCDMMLFSDGAKYVTPNPDDSVATIAGGMSFAMGGTNFHAIFETANKRYDRIVILSDMQGWMSGGLGQTGGAPSSVLAEYKRRFNADPFVYSWDLQGYGSMQFPERNVFALAGFSEKVFDLMRMLEVNKEAMVKAIEEIDFQAPQSSNG